MQQDYNIIDAVMISQHKQSTIFQTTPIQKSSLSSISLNILQKINNNQNQIPYSSNYRQLYIDYFSDVQSQADQNILSSFNNFQEKLANKLVIINSYSSLKQLISFSSPTILISGNLFGGIIIKYQIIVGNYKLKVDLLNINKNAPSGLKQIGQGGFGQIYRIRYSKNKYIVAKRIIFTCTTQLKFEQSQILPNNMEINQTLHEYSIYKICSFYKIGPKITNQMGFDIICFSNCIQFYMEQCLRLKQNYQGIQKDLKTCLRILHKINIVHKDIKPPNILFSYQHKKFVLTDFGLAHSIQQKLGYKTRTYKQGSPGFMAPQMQKLNKGKQNYVDLYYNDLHGLKCTIMELMKYEQKKYPKIMENKDKQQLSEVLNYLDQEIYKCIYLLNILLKIKSNFIKLSKKDQNHYFKFINIMLKQIFQITLPYQYPITAHSILHLIYNKHYQSNIPYLIRSYGISLDLLYQLKKMPNTEKVKKLKFKIESQKQMYFMPEQKIRKWKEIQYYNKYQFCLEHQLLYYRYLQKQYNKCFRQKISEILLQIFYLKIVKDSDYLTLMKLFNDIQCHINKGDITDNQEILVFKSICQISLQKQWACQDSIQICKKLYPKSIPKVYSFLIKYFTINPKKQQQIIKYGRRLQSIYQQNFQTHIEQYLQILFELATAYQKKNQNFCLHYYQSLKQQTLKYIHKISENNPFIIDCYQYIGMFYYTYNLYGQALSYYQKQLMMIKYFYGDYQIQSAKCYLNIAKCHIQLKNFQEAQQYTKLALEIVNFYNYYKEYSKIQDECMCLLCIISILLSKEELVAWYYNELIQREKKKWLRKFNYDNYLCNQDKGISNNKIQGYKQKLNQIYRLICEDRIDKQSNDYKEIQIQINFLTYVREKKFLNKIKSQIEKYEKSSIFINKKFNLLKANEKILSEYINSKFKLALAKNQNKNKIYLFKSCIELHHIFHNQYNVQANQIYKNIIQQYQSINKIQKSLQYSNKRAHLIITNPSLFDKFQLMKCLLKSKKYYFKLNQFSDSIYYFKTFMNRYKDAQINFINDILSQLYAYSSMVNNKMKAFKYGLKYYKLKKNLKSEKYMELKQLCKILNKKELICMIQQYCIQFKLQNKNINVSLKHQDDKLHKIKNWKKFKFLKRKANIFRLINNKSIQQSIVFAKQTLL